MQEERHDGRLTQIGGIHVAQSKLYLVGHPGLLCGRLRAGEQDRIDLDADTSRPVLLRGGDRDPPIARAEIEDDILGPDAGHLQHFAHDRHRGRFVSHVPARDSSACEPDRQNGGERHTGHEPHEDHTALSPARTRSPAHGRHSMLWTWIRIPAKRRGLPP